MFLLCCCCPDWMLLPCSVCFHIWGCVKEWTILSKLDKISHKISRMPECNIFKGWEAPHSYLM